MATRADFPCECPKCGLASNELGPDSPVVMSRLGKYVVLACDRCGNRWFVKEGEKEGRCADPA